MLSIRNFHCASARAKTWRTALTIAVAVAPTAALAQFVEDDVELLYTLQGDQIGDNFGWVAANLPDLDGDGIQDLIIPSISFNGVGRVSLFSGRDGELFHDIQPATGTLFGWSVGVAGDVNDDGVGDYIIGGRPTQVFSGRDHSVLFNVDATVGFASAVSAAGDLNRDGYDDFMVGAQFDATGGPGAGRLFALSGKDASILWSRNGEPGTSLGSAVGLVGDVNRDRVPDIVVGAFNAGLAQGGEAWVLSGKDGSVIHLLQPVDPAEASVFGQFFAAGAGDVDGDRVPDVFVGDYFEGAGPRTATGRAYIFSGRTGELVHVFTGFSNGDGLGPGRGIPDVNGDRFNDVIVAAYLNSDAAPAAGAAYIFSGRSGALLRTITATIAGDNFGVDALTVGDVNGDRIPDYAMTAVGLSFNGTETGRTYVIAGDRLPCPADLNGNGFVGRRDIKAVQRAFGEVGGPADLNGDGIVDALDLTVAQLDRGRCPRGVPRKTKCRRRHCRGDDDDDDER